MKKGKKYIKAVELFDKHNAYSKEEAIDLVKKTSTSKFDGSVEVAVRLNVDTKKTDQQVRGAIVLPNGTGKSKTVLVLTKNDAQAKAAKAAGAEFVGGEELIEKIAKENKKLPQEIDYLSIDGLRIEARQKLDAIRPVSIGQASRISGVSPADISVLLIYLEQMRRTRGDKNEQ